MKPWSGENVAASIIRPLRHNGLPYRGINILMSWGAAIERGYSNSTWMSYRQAQELGGQVRKGEKGSLVVYANTITKTEESEDGQEEERSIPYMKGYTVFNVEQIDGLPARYMVKPETMSAPAAERVEHAELFFAATGANIRHGGNSAYYAPHTDHIQMPPFEAFTDAESHAATLAHKLTHWTKHESRLKRDLGRKRWGDEGYAREELVAEMGAAFLCADLSITPEIREDHAAYIDHWLKALKNDKRAIFSSAAHTQKATDYLKSLQPGAQQTAA
jgi:antirestriction protein ArdC